MSDIYLVLNETSFFGTDDITTEVVSAHDSLQGALDEIHSIAQTNDVFIESDADSVVFYSPPGTSIEADEYYIAEMELKSNG